jgi:hypothetical protein
MAVAASVGALVDSPGLSSSFALPLVGVHTDLLPVPEVVDEAVEDDEVVGAAFVEAFEVAAFWFAEDEACACCC